jgi:hypothetical protein
MAANHFLELRLFENEIATFCSKNCGNQNILRVVREALSENSQLQFKGIVFDHIKRRNFLVCSQFPLFLEDVAFTR